MKTLIISLAFVAVAVVSGASAYALTAVNYVPTEQTLKVAAPVAQPELRVVNSSDITPAPLKGVQANTINPQPAAAL